MPVKEGDIVATINELNSAFEEFKAENTKQIDGVRKGFDDVITREKVDRINADIGGLQATVDELNIGLAAMQVGSATDGVNADVREHSAAFSTWFKSGQEAGLKGLEIKAALSVGSDPDGGYTAPAEIETAIDEVLKEISPVRAIATVRRTSNASYKKLVNLHGTASGWVGETEARAETSGPTLSELEFPSMEVYANPAATQGLLDDSIIDIGAWLSSEVDMEFAQQEGNAFTLGTGVKKPRGFLGYTNVANASYVWGSVGYVATGAAGAFKTTAEGDDYDNLVDLQQSLESAYRPNARFAMNRLTQGVVRKIKDANGNPTWIPTMVPGQPATLFGDPISEIPDMPDIAANSYSIAYGDFRRAYLIVDRAGIRVLRDPYTNKPFVQFYTTKRVGGGIQNFEAIKLLKFAAS